MVHIPYRWLPRTVFKNLNHMWWDIRNGVRNVCRWIPVIWFDADWDWCFLAQIMETKLNWMVKNSEKWHVMRAPEDRKNMRICAQLLHRLQEDNYVENAFKRFDGQPKFAYKHAMDQSKEDQKYLGVILGKYLTHWWD